MINISILSFCNHEHYIPYLHIRHQQSIYITMESCLTFIIPCSTNIAHQICILVTKSNNLLNVKPLSIMVPCSTNITHGICILACHLDTVDWWKGNAISMHDLCSSSVPWEMMAPCCNLLFPVGSWPLKVSHWGCCVTHCEYGWQWLLQVYRQEAHNLIVLPSTGPHYITGTGHIPSA